MSQDDIIKLAHETDVLDPQHFGSVWADKLYRFANLVAAAEREACAKIVENYCGAWSDEGYALAAAIRARGGK